MHAKRATRSPHQASREHLLPLSLLVVTTLALLLAACGGDDGDSQSSPTPSTAAGLTVDLDGVRFRSAWARPALASDPADAAAHETMDTATDTHADMAAGGSITTSAIYFTVENTTDAVLRISAATTDAANVVELHETTLDDGMMQMAPVPHLEVPANDSLTLEPGGLHLMLIGLTRDLVAGETLNLTLTTDAGSTLVLEGIPVREPGT